VNLRALHASAMARAEEAAQARRKGHKKALALFEQAFESERQAASLVSSDNEPTFSVLHRSAASLAIDCGRFRDAEKLISRALAAEPPDEIAEELRELLDQVYFNMSLNLRGLALEEEEFEMTISGDLARSRYVQSDELIGRMDDMKRLIYRTAERRANLPFREAGAVPKAIKDEMDVYISSPNEGHNRFSVNFHVARPRSQTELWRSPKPAQVINDIMSCLELVERKEEKKLERKIEDPAYLRNFLGLARHLAPDGQAVKAVGFSAMHGKINRQVTVTRPSRTIPSFKGYAVAVTEDGVEKLFTGQLLAADGSDKRQAYIQVVLQSGRPSPKVRVPEGMMADIVRPLWEERVDVQCVQVSGVWNLVDIRRSTEAHTLAKAIESV